MSHQALGGIWVLNHDRGDLPGAASSPDGADQGGRRGGGGGVSGRMGRGGRGRGYGGDQAEHDGDIARRQAMMDYVRTATESPKQVTIVVRGESVSITDADGRVQVLPTDDKKIDARAENGLIKVTTRNHWDGDTLLSEVDIEGGAKIIRSYALSPGGTELRLSTSVDGQGRPINLIRFYERPVESR